MMVKVSRKRHETKRGKLEITNKKIDKHAENHSTKLHKNQTKILTNARLTVPHLQTGIFMKGKSSHSYHRKEESRFNVLNKARMNEKLSEILSFAKNSDKPHEKMTYKDTDSFNEESYLPSKNFSLAKGNISCSTSSITSDEQHEGIKLYQIPRRSSENESANEDEIRKGKKNLDGLNLPLDSIHFGDNSDHKDFKLFLTFFDNTVSFQHTFTEDFISNEKLDLKKKKRLSACNIIQQSRTSNPEEGLFHSTNPEGTNKTRENGATRNMNDQKNNRRISKPKHNPNYNVFKNTKQMNILYRQQDKYQLTTKNILFESPLPENSHKRSMCYDNKNSSNDEFVFQTTNKCEEKSFLLNPISFLANSLPENHDQFFSLVSKKSSLDEFQFPKHKHFSSSISAPPGLNIPSEHKEEPSPFKILSQPCISRYKNEGETNFKKFEIPEHHKHSPSHHHFSENLLIHSSQPSVKKNSSFELFFEDQNEIPHHFGKLQEADKFPNDDLSPIGICDFTNHFKYGSQSRRSKSLFSLVGETISNKNEPENPVYSPIVTTLTSPIRDNSNKYCVIENRSNLPLYDIQSTFQRAKIDISSVLNSQEVDVRQNNFWYRRKMF